MTENQEQRPIPERNRDIQRRQESMWILNNEDYREYEAFKANGMTPNEVLALRQGVYPDDEGRAPHPDFDPPANQCVSCGREMPEGGWVCKGCEP